MLKNFAIENEVSVKGKGINAKMNEFQAALDCFNSSILININCRKRLYNYYLLLSNVG